MASLDNVKDESSPIISGNVPSNDKYLSKYESDITKKMQREYHQKRGKTVFDMTINEIVENTAKFIEGFQSGYAYKVHKVESEYKLYNEGSGGFFENIKKYMMALVLYLSDNDNMLYFGIIMVTLSIILYFFNISV